MPYRFPVSRLVASAGLMIAVALTPALLAAQTQSPQAANSGHRVDNSAQNKGQSKTADQQLNDKSDVQITQQIRQAVIADRSLSLYGHNIKIISRNGAVTLKGPVHSAQEKQSILNDAEGVVGAGKVTDKITIKGGNKPSADNAGATQ